MYEGRNAQLFAPDTGVITWMSNPAQPSFVWQLYHYDLEPNASLFAVKSASELVHIQMNEANGTLQVINNLPTAISTATPRTSPSTTSAAMAVSCAREGHPRQRPRRHRHRPRPHAVAEKHLPALLHRSSISAMHRARSSPAISTGNRMPAHAQRPHAARLAAHRQTRRHHRPPAIQRPIASASKSP